MKKVILLLLLINIITSCRTFTTHVYPEKEFPPIESEEPVIVYTPFQELPDSAEFVGKVHMFINPSGPPYYTNITIMRSMEGEVKAHGGNAVKLDEKQKSEDHLQFLVGDVYRLKPFEKIQIHSIDRLKKVLKNNPNSEFEGIYKVELDFICDLCDGIYAYYACLKQDNGDYKLYYLYGFEKLYDSMYGFWELTRIWKIGDLSSTLNKTVNSNLFKTDYYLPNKEMLKNSVGKFENGNLRLYVSDNLRMFRKVYPDTAVYEEVLGGLTLSLIHI